METTSVEKHAVIGEEWVSALAMDLVFNSQTPRSRVSLQAVCSDPLMVTPASRRLRLSAEERVCEQPLKFKNFSNFELEAKTSEMEKMRERYEQEKSAIFTELNNLVHDKSLTCPSPIPFSMCRDSKIEHQQGRLSGEESTLLQQMDVLVYKNLMEKLEAVDNSASIKAELDDVKAQLIAKTTALEDLKAKHELETSELFQELNNLAKDRSLVCPSPIPNKEITRSGNGQLDLSVGLVVNRSIAGTLREEMETLQAQVNDMKTELVEKTVAMDKLRERNEQELASIFQELNYLVNDSSLVCPSPAPLKRPFATRSDEQTESTHNVSLLEQMNALVYKNLMEKLQAVDEAVGAKSKLQELESEVRRQSECNANLKAKLEEATRLIARQRNEEAQKKVDRDNETHDNLQQTKVLEERIEELKKCKELLESQCETMALETAEHKGNLEKLTKQSTVLTSKLSKVEEDNSDLCEKLLRLRTELSETNAINANINDQLEVKLQELSVARDQVENLSRSSEESQHIESKVASLRDEKDALENEIITMGEKLQDAFAEVEENKREIDSLNNELVSLKSNHCLEIIELTENNATADAEQKRRLAELNEELGVAKRNAGEAHDNLQRCEEKLKEMEATKNEVILEQKAEIQTLKSNAQLIEEEKLVVQSLLKEKTERLSSCSQQISDLISSEADLKKRIDEHVLQVNDYRNQVNASAEELEKSKKALARYEQDACDLTQKLNEAQAKGEYCHELEEKIELLKEDLEQEQSMSKSLIKSNEELKENIDQLQLSIKEKENELVRQKTKEMKSLEELEVIQRQNEKNNACIDKLNQKNAELASEIDGLKSNLQDMRNAVDNDEAGKQRLANMDEIVKDLEARYASRRKILLTTLKNKEREYEKLCNENEDLRAAIDDLNISLKEAKRNQDQIRSELDKEKSLENKKKTSIIPHTLAMHKNDIASIGVTQKKRLLSSPQKLLTKEEKKSRILSPQALNKVPNKTRSTTSRVNSNVNLASSETSTKPAVSSQSMSNLSGAVKKRSTTMLLAKKPATNPFEVTKSEGKENRNLEK